MYFRCQLLIWFRGRGNNDTQVLNWMVETEKFCERGLCQQLFDYLELS